MKTALALLIMLLPPALALSQDKIYATQKAFFANEPEEVTLPLKIERRTPTQIKMYGGADIRITVDEDDAANRMLKRRTFAVRSARGDLYINCRRLRYGKFRFGSWYAPAMQIGEDIYFSAIPMGTMIGDSFVVKENNRLAGSVGDAIASSGLVHHRVYYVLEAATGKVEFVSKERILTLLSSRPALRDEYAAERGNVQEASLVCKYLQRLAAQ